MLARAIPYMPDRRPPRRRRPGRRRRRAARSRSGRATAASSSAPTTACSRWPRRASEIEAARELDERALPPRARVADVPRARRLRAGRGAPRRRRRLRRPRRGDRPRDARAASTLPEPRVSAGADPRDGARRRPLRQPPAQPQPRAHRRRSASRPATASSCGSTLDPFYAVVAETYADASRGELILYEDSYGAIAIAISGGNAARLTGAGARRRGPHRWRRDLRPADDAPDHGRGRATAAAVAARTPVRRHEFDRLAPEWDASCVDRQARRDRRRVAAVPAARPGRSTSAPGPARARLRSGALARRGGRRRRRVATDGRGGAQARGAPASATTSPTPRRCRTRTARSTWWH